MGYEDVGDLYLMEVGARCDEGTGRRQVRLYVQPMNRNGSVWRHRFRVEIRRFFLLSDYFGPFCAVASYGGLLQSSWEARTRHSLCFAGKIQ